MKPTKLKLCTASEVNIMQVAIDHLIEHLKEVISCPSTIMKTQTGAEYTMKICDTYAENITSADDKINIERLINAARIKERLA